MSVRPSHRHIFAVANTLLQGCRAQRLRILDIGCGDARLMNHLYESIRLEFKECEVEVYGFDISEQGYCDSGQHASALQRLNQAHPHERWEDRIGSWSAQSDWEYPPGFFDLAVSNQVLEHVQNLDHFLSNLKRCLKPGGRAVHFFPLGSHVFEAHTNMPFVHYIKDFDSRVAYATLLNHLGIGRFRRDQAVRGFKSARCHAQDAAEFVQSCTFYRSFGEFYRLCNEHQLSVSRRFTKDFYFTKLRAMLGATPPRVYRSARMPLMNWLSFFALKYVSSITLDMESVDYDIGQRIVCEKQYLTGQKLSPAA